MLRRVASFNQGIDINLTYFSQVARTCITKSPQPSRVAEKTCSMLYVTSHVFTVVWTGVVTASAICKCCTTFKQKKNEINMY